MPQTSSHQKSKDYFQRVLNLNVSLLQFAIAFASSFLNDSVLGYTSVLWPDHVSVLPKTKFECWGWCVGCCCCCGWCCCCCWWQCLIFSECFHLHPFILHFHTNFFAKEEWQIEEGKMNAQHSLVDKSFFCPHSHWLYPFDTHWYNPTWKNTSMWQPPFGGI